MIENYRKLMYYAIMTVVLFSCVQQTVASDSSTEGILVNYTAKRYLFEQSTVREFFSGAYYDLFLVIRGSGVFRCSEVVLPAQQQNLIILKPGQGGRLEYAGTYGPLVKPSYIPLTNKKFILFIHIGKIFVIQKHSVDHNILCGKQ